MTVRGGGVPWSLLASMPFNRMGPPPRSFAADAHACIMVGSWTRRIQGCGAIRAHKAGSPQIVIPDRIKRAVVLEAVKVWPGDGGVCRKVGATTNLDSSCARRPGNIAGRGEETGFQIEQRNLSRKQERSLL